MARSNKPKSPEKDDDPQAETAAPEAIGETPRVELAEYEPRVTVVENPLAAAIASLTSRVAALETAMADLRASMPDPTDRLTALEHGASELHRLCAGLNDNLGALSSRLEHVETIRPPAGLSPDEIRALRRTNAAAEVVVISSWARNYAGELAPGARIRLDHVPRLEDWVADGLQVRRV